MPFLGFRRRKRLEQFSHALYVAIIEQSRRAEFYTRLGVPDSLDGRFDLIVLHAVLVMRALKQCGPETVADARDLSQSLFDLMFADMDQNLRELGVSDMSVGKRVKQMARAFYGRAAAYEDGLAQGGLEDALARNLYGTLEEVPEAAWCVAMADYVRRCGSTVDPEALLAGKVVFPEVEPTP